MSRINPSTASNLAFTNGSQPLGTKGASDGDVLTWDTGTNTWRAEAAASTGIGGSTGSVDNALLRANGTGGSTLQNSAVIVDDSGNMSGVAALSTTTIELGHASDTTLARSSAGNVSIEGNVIYRAGGTDVAVADGGTGTSQSSTTMPYASDASVSIVVLGRSEDLCAGGDVANLITSTPAGWFTANTANSSFARASNVVTLTRNNSGGSEDRNNLTFPYIARKFSGRGGRIISRFNCTGSADFRLGGSFVHIGSTTAAAYAGLFSWGTTLQCWSPTAVPTGGTVTITQSQYIWSWMEFSVAGATVYYSTSTSEPTAEGATASTQWVRLGFLPFTAATSSAGMAASLIAGAHTCYIAGTLAQYVANFTTLRAEW